MVGTGAMVPVAVRRSLRDWDWGLMDWGVVGSGSGGVGGEGEEQRAGREVRCSAPERGWLDLDYLLDWWEV